MARACLILVLKTKEEKWGLGKKTKIFKTSLDIILLSDIFFFSPGMKVKNVGVLFFKGDKKTKWLVKWNMEKVSTWVSHTILTTYWKTSFVCKLWWKRKSHENEFQEGL